MNQKIATPTRDSYLADLLALGYAIDRDGQRRDIFPAGIPKSAGEFLGRLIAETRPIRTLEVGMGPGISTLFICEALKRIGSSEHFVIDPYQNANWSLGNGIGLLNVERAGYKDMIRFIEKPSHIALSWLEDTGTKIDFAFIDGDHTFDYTLVDFVLVDRILNVGGTIVFDDVTWPGVEKVLKFIQTNRTFQHISSVEVAEPNESGEIEKHVRCMAFRKIRDDDYDRRALGRENHFFEF